MIYPVSYQIEDGNIQVTANKEGSDYLFNLTLADGSNMSFCYTEQESNRIALKDPIRQRCQYHAMVALWQLQIL